MSHHEHQTGGHRGTPAGAGLLALLLSLAALIATPGCDAPDPTAGADPAAVLAPDLIEQLADRDAAEPVEVIVQYQPGPSRTLGCAPTTGAPDAEADSADGVLRRLDGDVRRTFHHLDAFAATLPAGHVAELAACGHVTRISPDRPLQGALAVEDLAARTSGAAAVHGALVGVEATGDGVTVAVIDSGVWKNHRGVKQCGEWLGEISFAGASDDDEVHHRRDPYGHGTMVAGGLCGDADGARGIAPDVSLGSIQVLDDEGLGATSDAIAALEWVLDHGHEYDLRVVNLSVGSAAAESYRTDPLAQAAEALVAEGVVVVAAAGNLGRSDGEEVHGGILSPAHHPAVITVGAADAAGTAVRSDDSVAWFSSRGPTLVDGVAKPDLVAPGAELPLPVRRGSTLHDAYGELEVELDDSGGRHRWLSASGTSFAAPLVTGTVALMLEVNPDLEPTEVKAILQGTAQVLPGADPLAQGAGLLNTAGAVQLASIWDPSDDLEPGDPQLTEELPEQPSNVIEGEDVLWGTGIIWNGTVISEQRLLLQPFAEMTIGDLEGTGIIWNGYHADAGELLWLDYNVRGIDLLRVHQEAYEDGVLWGTGIIWNGLVLYEPSVCFSAPAMTQWSGWLIAPEALGAGLVTPGALAVEEPTGLLDGEQGTIVVPEFD